MKSCGERGIGIAVNTAAIGIMIRAEHQFPESCPACRLREGMPFMAETMANGSMCIHVRCRGCRHEWMLEMPPTEVALAAKPDRRAVSKTPAEGA